MVASLSFIGSIIAIWLALRTANMSGENPDTNLFGKILSTVFGLIIVAGTWQSFGIAANGWAIAANNITALGVDNMSNPEFAQGFIDFVGTTEPSGMPSIMGMAFLLTITIMIIGLIWGPRGK
jgi:protein-S-isoprenylcysteine O-methyltransferase Ste14